MSRETTSGSVHPARPALNLALPSLAAVSRSRSGPSEGPTNRQTERLGRSRFVLEHAVRGSGEKERGEARHVRAPRKPGPIWAPLAQGAASPSFCALTQTGELTDVYRATEQIASKTQRQPSQPAGQKQSDMTAYEGAHSKVSLPFSTTSNCRCIPRPNHAPRRQPRRTRRPVVVSCCCCDRV